MWEVIICMLIINKKQIGPDKWSEILNHSTSIEDMIITIWSKEALY